MGRSTALAAPAATAYKPRVFRTTKQGSDQAMPGGNVETKVVWGGAAAVPPGDNGFVNAHWLNAAKDEVIIPADVIDDADPDTPLVAVVSTVILLSSVNTTGTYRRVALQCRKATGGTTSKNQNTQNAASSPRAFPNRMVWPVAVGDAFFVTLVHDATASLNVLGSVSGFSCVFAVNVMAAAPMI